MIAEMSAEPTGKPTRFAPRLPAPNTPRRRSLRTEDLDSLSPADREAVEYLLALPGLDDD
jgi:hypothetical protein